MNRVKLPIVIFFIFLGRIAASGQPTIGRHESADTPVGYFIPGKEIPFDPGVPSPKEFFGFTPGDGYVDWNGTLSYFRELERTSDRIKLEYYGRTAEGRQMFQAVFSSAKNIRNLETIRKKHLANTDLSKPVTDCSYRGMPLVISLMGSIHGNEASGVNALVIAAYYYAAGRSPELDNLLRNVVILINPGLNPDGINRFCDRVYSTAGINPTTDKNAIEFSARQVGMSRQNHYWNDCNRDWLAIRFPETKNAVRMYMKWMPNVVLDLHEQGMKPDGMYFFSPGDPRRVHNCIPMENQELTGEISEATRAVFDSIGLPYFSGKGYDDYYIGKGAAYGDVQGSVCLLHEQTGSRGFMRKSPHFGEFTFASTVRNQCHSAISLTYRSLELKEKLLDYQRRYFVNEARDASMDEYAGYVFSSPGDCGTEYITLDMLLTHNISVYPSAEREGEWVVPFRRKHYKKVKAIFDTDTEFSDSTFYDISTWTIPLSFGLKYEKVKVLPELGERLTEVSFPSGGYLGKAERPQYYSYSASEFYSPAMTAQLQRAGVGVSVTSNGLFVVPAESGKMSRDSLRMVLEAASSKSGVPFSDYTKSPTDTLSGVRKPRTAVIIGMDTNWKGWQSAGQHWYLLDWCYNMPHSLVMYYKMKDSKFDYDNYNVMIFCSKATNEITEDAAVCGRLKKWVENGGTLIAMKDAGNIASSIGLEPPTFRNEGSGARTSGVILSTDYRRDNPLMWGYTKDSIPIFKHRDGVWSAPSDAVTVMRFRDEPYISGCISPARLYTLPGSPVVFYQRLEKGSIVYITEEVDFRSAWLGTSHILTNAIYFGDKL